MTRTMMQQQTSNIIGLDVGDQRVGVAMTNTVARLPSPHSTLVRDEFFWEKLAILIRENDIATAVVGLPRNLRGEDTPQTEKTKTFIEELKQRTGVMVKTQDEALTSRQAETELQTRGKNFAKGDIDALAATYILEDYLNARGN